MQKCNKKQREKHTASQSITSSFDAQAFSAFSALIPYVVGTRIISIHISCDMYLRLGLHVQIRLYYVLPYKANIFILDQFIVYFRLTMPNLQKKRQLIFEIFNIKKAHFCFGTECRNITAKERNRYVQILFHIV